MRRPGLRGYAAVIMAAGLSVLSTGPAHALSAEAKEMQVEAERIISPYTAVMEKAPKGVPSRSTVDAPLLGNGSLGAVIAVENHTWPLQFWVMKSNFCKLRHDHRKGGPRPFGGLDIPIPALKGGTWRTEQHIYSAITSGRFTKGDLAVNMRAYVAATDCFLIVELTAGGGTLDAAFLVSSVLKGGMVQFVKIQSEKGRDCTIVNPWPGKAVVVYRDGRKIAMLKGDRLVMKTTAGVTVVLGPEGKGYPRER